uniref:Uncharacterized protein n=1 Tax=Cacopsylla melanoneura TaxID=428564 RepID=A0A8D8WT58_9HEMI
MKQRGKKNVHLSKILSLSYKESILFFWISIQRRKKRRKNSELVLNDNPICFIFYLSGHYGFRSNLVNINKRTLKTEDIPCIPIAFMALDLCVTPNLGPI